MTRIVILGGGFGGVAAARELDRLVGGDPDVRVTLVNRDNFFLFTPMLHEVAASDLDLTHIVSPIRKLFRRVTLFTGEVERIDLDARRVTVSHGEGHHHHELAYDHLVLALGTITNFFGLEGLAERACTMKSLGDAVHLRNRLIRLLEEADFECAAAAREPLLTVVVAGGGFAGVETMAAINDFVRHAARFYARLRDARVRMVIVHPGPVLLPELDPALGRYAAEKLAARGVEVRLGVKVARSSDGAVELSDGTVIRSHTIVWTAGTTGNPRVGALPCAGAQGRVQVEGTLAVPGWPGVWAVGDCAVVPDPHTGGAYAPTAQHAIRQGARVARNIVAALKGQAPQPYTYRAVGQLAAIGRRAGVAQLFGMKFSGFPAWWLWRTIYLGKLPRLEKKVRVALDWTLDLLFSKDFVQYSTGRAPSASTVMHDDEQPPAAPTLMMPPRAYAEGTAGV
ncbi:MAG: NAD(P)/FAD-dependent oxidoreductase [Gemmatimonadaceae bacterium]